MKSEKLEKLTKKWVKWEPIALYFLFSFSFNFEAYFWINPIYEIYNFSITYYITLLSLSLIPLYLNVTLYVKTTHELKVFYRITSFVSNILFFSITLLMKGQFLLYLFWLLVILLLTFFLSFVLAEGLISHSWDFAKKVLKETLEVVFFILIMIVLNFLFQAELPGVFLLPMFALMPGFVLAVIIIIRFRAFIKA